MYTLLNDLSKNRFVLKYLTDFERQDILTRDMDKYEHYCQPFSVYERMYIASLVASANFLLLRRPVLAIATRKMFFQNQLQFDMRYYVSFKKLCREGVLSLALLTIQATPFQQMLVAAIPKASQLRWPLLCSHSVLPGHFFAQF